MVESFYPGFCCVNSLHLKVTISFLFTFCLCYHSNVFVVALLSWLIVWTTGCKFESWHLWGSTNYSFTSVAASAPTSLQMVQNFFSSTSMFQMPNADWHRNFYTCAIVGFLCGRYSINKWIWMLQCTSNLLVFIFKKNKLVRSFLISRKKQVKWVISFNGQSFCYLNVSEEQEFTGARKGTPFPGIINYIGIELSELFLTSRVLDYQFILIYIALKLTTLWYEHLHTSFSHQLLLRSRLEWEASVMWLHCVLVGSWWHEVSEFYFL